jgi:hypothetical protein
VCVLWSCMWSWGVVAYMPSCHGAMCLQRLWIAVELSKMLLRPCWPWNMFDNLTATHGHWVHMAMFRSLTLVAGHRPRGQNTRQGVQPMVEWCRRGAKALHVHKGLLYKGALD